MTVKLVAIDRNPFSFLDQGISQEPSWLLEWIVPYALIDAYFEHNLRSHRRFSTLPLTNTVSGLCLIHAFKVHAHVLLGAKNQGCCNIIPTPTTYQGGRIC